MTANDVVTVPDLRGHFGKFGGRFVPEALMAALDELGGGEEGVGIVLLQHEAVRHHGRHLGYHIQILHAPAHPERAQRGSGRVAAPPRRRCPH